MRHVYPSTGRSRCLSGADPAASASAATFAPAAAPAERTPGAARGRRRERAVGVGADAVGEVTHRAVARPTAAVTQVPHREVGAVGDVLREAAGELRADAERNRVDEVALPEHEVARGCGPELREVVE